MCYVKKDIANLQDIMDSASTRGITNAKTARKGLRVAYHVKALTVLVEGISQI